MVCLFSKSKSITLSLIIIESYYYQYNEKRLSVCTLTIHGLLHICDNIRFCGPVWTTWTFWMECYCGHLQAGLRSHSHPWMNLNNRVLHKAYVEFTDVFYNLEDLVSNPPTVERKITYVGCKYCLHFQIMNLHTTSIYRPSVQSKDTTYKKVPT